MLLYETDHVAFVVPVANAWPDVNGSRAILV